jgi:prepilin-type N-terminal cleavage/methylation domain-containing protein
MARRNIIMNLMHTFGIGLKPSRRRTPRRGANETRRPGSRAGAKPREAKSGFPIRSGRAGFTLLETMVALSIFSMVLIGLQRMVMSNERAQEVGTRISHVNQNIRAALEIVSRDLRMAGSGFAGIPVQTSNGSVREVIYPITPGYASGAPADSVSVLAGLGEAATMLAAAMDSPASDIDCLSVDGFEAGDLVVVTDGVSADLFEVTSVSLGSAKLHHSSSSPRNVPAGHSQWPAGGYPAGSRAVKVSIITLKTEESGGVLRLTRKVDDDPAVALVENVKNLTFTYRLSDGTQTRNPASPAQIQEVILSLEAALRSGWGLDSRSVVTNTSVRPRSV